MTKVRAWQTLLGLVVVWLFAAAPARGAVRRGLAALGSGA